MSHDEGADEPTGFMPDPRHKHLALLNRHLFEGDVVIFTDDDGSRRHYRVNDRQRLPPHVHLEPHVTLIRSEPPPPVMMGEPQVEETGPVIGPSVWERLRQP